MSEEEARRAGLGRRGFMVGALSLLVAFGVAPRRARAMVARPRRLTMVGVHTGERVDAEYFDGERLLPDGVAELERVLRDFRTGDVHWIDPGVLDIAWSLAQASGVGHPTFEIVSGYRSPTTNSMLHERSAGVAVHSLHLQGRALDLRLRGFPTVGLRDLALALGRGGVGFYGASDFVHVDTGRIRRW